MKSGDNVLGCAGYYAIEIRDTLFRSIELIEMSMKESNKTTIKRSVSIYSNQKYDTLGLRNRRSSGE